MDDNHIDSDPASATGSAPHFGLTAAQVAERRARGAVNRPPADRAGEYADLFVRNVATPFNVLVVPAAVALFWLDELRGAWAVSALAVVNSSVGLIQEFRAKRRLEKLALLGETKVRAIRDGIETTIAAGDVVFGDHLQLAAGEFIVADGRVLDANYLEIDEALLTGESDPTPRAIGDELLSGSHCVAGAGVYRADRIGAQSFAQQTSAEARRYRFAPSPMQKTLDKLVRVLTVIAVLLCVMYVVLFWLRGFPVTDLWQMIAATVTSMVPQGLVLMTTMAFTLGAIRMSAQGAIVQRLNAIEAMAAVDVLCMDKTGTLTTNRLSVDRIVCLDMNRNAVELGLRQFAWTSIDAGNKGLEALRIHLGPLSPQARVEPIDHLPFKSQNRFSGLRFRCQGIERTLILGSFEALKIHLTEADADLAESEYRRLLPMGLRLLLFADGKPPTAEQTFANGISDLRLRPLALVALQDELRTEAAEVLAELSKQGIAFKILSGDNAETVRATVRVALPSLANAPVMTGADFANSKHPRDVIRNVTVFGRVSPSQKLDIVASLQEDGQNVGMLGDGVNDVLPIKRADLGIAMGAGCAATKTVAALVLENNNFGLLPATLQEGRTILGNLRKAAKLFLLKNVYTLLLIVAALGVFKLDFPYLPQQVSLLNALTIGVPSLFIVLRRPRSTPLPSSSFLRDVGVFAVVGGAIVGVVAMTVWLFAARQWRADVNEQRTVLLATLVFMGAGIIALISERDIWLIAWSALAIGLFAAAVFCPWTADFFVLVRLSGIRWTLALVASSLGVGLLAMVHSRLMRWSGKDQQV